MAESDFKAVTPIMDAWVRGNVSNRHRPIVGHLCSRPIIGYYMHCVFMVMYSTCIAILVLQRSTGLKPALSPFSINLFNLPFNTTGLYIKIKINRNIERTG